MEFEIEFISKPSEKIILKEEENEKDNMEKEKIEKKKNKI